MHIGNSCPYSICLLLIGAILRCKASIQPELNITYENEEVKNLYIDSPYILPLVSYDATICHKGVWIIYDLQFYRGHELLYTLEGGCKEYAMYNIPKSARTVGFSEDNTIPSVTLFSEHYTHGKKFIVHAEIDVLPFPVRSFVTINTKVEFFWEENFQGDSFCVDEETRCYGTGVCSLSAWGTEMKVWDIELARSARIGCISPIYSNLLNITDTHGATTFIEQDHPSLDIEGYSEFCHQGVWTLYSDPQYRTWSGTIQQFKDECNGESTQILGSARSIGVDDNVATPSATFFSEAMFEGEIMMTTSSIPVLDFPIQSIVNIRTNIEMFREENYQGDSFCLNLHYLANCVNSICQLYDWGEANPPWDGTLAKSIKIGCML